MTIIFFIAGRGPLPQVIIINYCHSEELARREAPEDEVLRELQRAAREGIRTVPSLDSL
jgi:hypothetical protein